jgi:hypothetical protein
MCGINILSTIVVVANQNKFLILANKDLAAAGCSDM